MTYERRGRVFGDPIIKRPVYLKVGRRMVRWTERDRIVAERWAAAHVDDGPCDYCGTGDDRVHPWYCPNRPSARKEKVK